MRAAPSRLVAILSLLPSLGSLALGVGLLLEVESALGVVGASLFLVCGVLVLGSAVATRPYWRRSAAPVRQVLLDGEPADFFPRRTGLPTAMFDATMVLLGGWFAALGVVGTLDGTWLWAVLVAAPATYLLGFVVLRITGRFRAAGVWLTPTRLVNEHLGIRSEVALEDLLAMSPDAENLLLVPVDGASVHHQPQVPCLWRRATWPGTALVVATTDLAGGSEALAAGLGQRVAVDLGGPAGS